MRLGQCGLPVGVESALGHDPAFYEIAKRGPNFSFARTCGYSTERRADDCQANDVMHKPSRLPFFCSFLRFNFPLRSFSCLLLIEIGFCFRYDVLELFLQARTDLSGVASDQDSALDGATHGGPQQRRCERECDSGGTPH